MYETGTICVALWTQLLASAYMFEACEESKILATNANRKKRNIKKGVSKDKIVCRNL